MRSMDFIFISIVSTLKLFVDNAWIVHKVNSSAEINQNVCKHLATAESCEKSAAEMEKA